MSFISWLIVDFCLVICIQSCEGSKSLNLPNLTWNDTWNITGIQYPYHKAEFQLTRSLFIDQQDTVYISFGENALVATWKNGNHSPSHLYNGKDFATNFSSWLKIIDSFVKNFQVNIENIFSSSRDMEPLDAKLNIMNSLFVLNNSDIYVSDKTDKVIRIWRSNSSKGTIKFHESSCDAIFINQDNYVYCSVRKKNEIVRKFLSTNTTKWDSILSSNRNSAKTSEEQSNWPLPSLQILSLIPEKYLNFWNELRTESTCTNNKELAEPRGIFIDHESNLYVANSKCNNILQYQLHSNGTCVFKRSTSGIAGLNLSRPISIILDANRNLYVTDTKHHRIISINSNWTEWRCIVDKLDRANEGHLQLNYPISIGFDSVGNLLVSNMGSDQVLKFFLFKQQDFENSYYYGKTNLIPMNLDTQTSTTSIGSSSTSLTVNVRTATAANSSKNDFITAISNIYVGHTFDSTPEQKANNTISPSSSTTPTQNTIQHRADGTQQTIQKTSNIDSTVIEATSTARSKPGETKNQAAFVPKTCDDQLRIGSDCEISIHPCDSENPCKNSGTCIRDSTSMLGFRCECSNNFNGTHCENNIALCQPNTCLYDGICEVLNETDFFCNCTQGRHGKRCEWLMNFCENVKCLNQGICQNLATGFYCHCSSKSYSGRYCEEVSGALMVRVAISKTLGFIAAMAIAIVLIFIVVLDFLKYVLGIDVTKAELELIRKQRSMSKFRRFNIEKEFKQIKHEKHLISH